MTRGRYWLLMAEPDDSMLHGPSRQAEYFIRLRHLIIAPHVFDVIGLIEAMMPSACSMRVGAIKMSVIIARRHHKRHAGRGDARRSATPHGRYFDVLSGVIGLITGYHKSPR